MAEKKKDEPDKPFNENIDVRDLPDRSTPEQRQYAEQVKAQNEAAQSPQIETEEK